MTTTPLRRTVVDVVGAPFHAIWSPLDGAVLAAGFATENDPEARSLAKRLGHLDPDAVAGGIAASRDDEHPIARALHAYAAGDLRAIDALAVRQPETPFRGEVWRALRGVAPGEAVTYTELASIAGRPSAVRAAASGCASNLVALIVPCHRIIRRDGGLGGYLFGTEIKERLLQHEGAWQPDLVGLATSGSRA
ncbi:methylated-DNA--[protein]-cysteine S-methyltransferase [Leucobacter musarum]|uniref:methylated-DNA--[protein]-cysteine S-methyltransferase n=1 Tax=Leucobacter musarum TaxID=1930747 RepID=UPI0006A7A46C|nr:methylated-DNA--[protein]-cysteine S-methyltransferase [Leucobacter musarum]